MANMTNPTAHLNRVATSPTAHMRKVVKAQLYSQFRGGSIPIEIEVDKDASDSKKQQVDTLKQRIEEVWEKAQVFLPHGGEDLRVNLTDRAICYTDAQGEVQYLESNDPAFDELMKEVRTLSKAVLRRVKLDGPTAESFEISSPRWRERQSHSLNQYLINPHLGFGKLYDAMSPPQAGAPDPRDAALDRIVATEGLIYCFRNRVDRYVKEFRSEIESAAFQSATRAQKEECRRNLAGLERLAAELEDGQINREALFSAVGIWGDADPQVFANQLQKPKEIAAAMENILVNDLKPREDSRGRLTRLVQDHITHDRSWWQGQKELEDSIRIFAQEAADLGVQDRMEYLRRIEKHAGRDEKRVSGTQFFASNMIHLNAIDPADADVVAYKKYQEAVDAYWQWVAAGSTPPAPPIPPKPQLGSKINRGPFDPAAALKTLRIELSPNVMNALAEGLEEDRVAVALALHIAQQQTGATWQARAEAMKQANGLQGIFQ